MLQILVEIIQELENITDVQLKRSALSLDSIAPGETTIGVEATTRTRPWI